MGSVELMSTLEVQTQQLESKQFEVLMEELEHDVKSWQVHLRKISEFDLRVVSQKDSWNLQRHAAAKSAAASIIAQKASGWGLGQKMENKWFNMVTVTIFCKGANCSLDQVVILR